MPYKPPICPAYAQSQCLTLSPIPEAKSKVNSPVLSCKSSLFSCFEWSSASAIAPLMSQPHSCENASFSSCATSPAILDRLEQLNLQQQQQQQFASGSMPGISSILEQPTPFAVSLNANLGVGLGFTFLSPSSNGNTATTPFNTPDRPLAPKAIVTQFDPALIQMKLDSLSIPPLTPPYDEDLDTKEETDDNTPLHLWLQYRMEEAKQREEYEKESSDVLMSATPDSITKTLTKQVTKADGIALDSSPMKSTSSSHVQEDSEEEKDDEDVEQGQEDVIIVTHGKRISVQESCAIATLKRRSRLMGLYKEAGDIVDNDGLPADIEADEFGMKVDADTKLAETVQPDANEAEIAMNEDRSVSCFSSSTVIYLDDI